MDKLEMLERAVMELGGEVYSLKGTIEKSRTSHDNFLQIVKGLKQLLDEKGLITLEDFEAAVELGEAVERFSSHAEHAAHHELEKLKKSGH
jgi:hypothetical protein